jgi:hypothetical protein
METQTGYCLDETQEIHQVEAAKAGNLWAILNGPDHLVGKTLAAEFLHKSEEKAREEIEDRHRRLNLAFKSADLVGCLSIHKEGERKLLGAGKEDLERLAKEDKDHYRGWLENLEKSWTKANHEAPDLEKLAKTLRNHALIKEALSEPLAIDFIEIMAKEAKIRKSLNGPTL